jgi:hypothetical protein
MKKKPLDGSKPSGGRKCGNPTMDPERTSSCTAWARTLRRYELIVMKARGPACKVFLALKFHANCDGYCWPLVSTLQSLTGIRKRDTIFAALRELESLGIVYRRQLISRRGRNSPSLYRIGRKVEAMPEKANDLYVLGPAQQKARRRPAKRDLDLACEVPSNGTTGVPSNGASEVPSNGATGVPPDGTQNYSREPLNGTASSREGAVPQVSPPAEAESSPNMQLGKDATAPERAFLAFGYHAPFGHPQFINAVVIAAEKIRNGNLLELMEGVIVELGGKVPPAWYQAKHSLEQAAFENASAERAAAPRSNSFSCEDLRDHCAAAVALFETAAERHPTIARGLRTIAGSFQDRISTACDTTGDPDVEALEREIEPLDAEVFVLLETEAGKERTHEIRRELQTQLKTYTKMNLEELARIESQFMFARLLKEFGLPRLSLYYLLTPVTSPTAGRECNGVDVSEPSKRIAAASRGATCTAARRA